MLTYLRPQDGRRLAAQHLGAFVAGAILTGAIGYLLYNLAITGDALQAPYAAGADPTSQLGFKGGHTLAVGLRNEQAQMQSLLLVLNGWPRYVGVMFIFAAVLARYAIQLGLLLRCLRPPADERVCTLPFQRRLRRTSLLVRDGTFPHAAYGARC